MADLRFCPIHELDPLAVESALRDGDVLASPNLLHRPVGTYELNVHGFVRGPLRVEETCCTDGSRVRLPSDDVGYVISFPVRGPVTIDSWSVMSMPTRYMRCSSWFDRMSHWIHR